MAGGGEQGTKAVIAALLTSTVTAIAGLAAFAVTGASSLLATGAHSIADAGGQGVLLLGVRRVARDADERDPSGFGRERFYWGFVLAIVLLVVGGAVAIAGGVRTVRDPEPLTSPEWAFGVLGAGIVVQAWALRLAVRQAGEARRRATWSQVLRGSRAPALPVVVLQDAGALLGLVLALAATTAAEVTGDPVWDGIGALAIGVLLGLVAVVLVVELRSLLIGRSATRKEVEAITAAFEVDPAVRRLVSLRTQHQAPGDLLVAARVELDHELSFPEVAEVVHRIERTVRRAVPAARTMYIEPDVSDEHRAAPAIEHHEPGHELPADLRAKLEAEARRGSLGEHIVVEEDDRPA